MAIVSSSAGKGTLVSATVLAMPEGTTGGDEKEGVEVVGTAVFCSCSSAKVIIPLASPILFKTPITLLLIGSPLLSPDMDNLLFEGYVSLFSVFSVYVYLLYSVLYLNELKKT
jgi:hypothetical protein